MVLNLRGINDNGHTFASFVCHGQRFMSVRGNHEYATGYADSERGHNPVVDTVPYRTGYLAYLIDCQRETREPTYTTDLYNSRCN